MSKENYWNRRMSRRGWLGGAGGGAVAITSAAFVGCGDDDSGSTATAAPAGSATKAPSGASPAAGASPSAAATQAGTPKRGGTLKRTSSVGNAQHWDPALDASNVMYEGGYDIYSKLLKWDAAGANMLLDLAEAMPEAADGGLTYIYKLRAGTKFSDGSPLTSEDVAFTYQRIADPATASPHQYKVGPLVSVTTPDDRTVVFKLSKPFVPFVSFSASGWLFIVSKKWVTAKGAKFTEPLGSGPYRIKSRQVGVSTVFERNPEYYVKDKPYIDGIEYRIIPDDATRQSALIAGDIDFLQKIVDKASADKIAQANSKLQDFKAPIRDYTFFLMNCAKPPFSDKRVRQAFHRLIDRDAFGKIVFSSGAKASGPVTWSWPKYAIPDAELAKLPGYRADRDTDIKDAKALLAAAGATNLKLKMPTVSTTFFNTAAVYLKDAFSQFGIDMQLDIGDFTALFAKRTAGDFDCMQYTNGGSQEIDEHIYGPHYTGQPRNVNKYSNKDLDDLLDKTRVTLDDAARTKLVRDVQDKLLDEVPNSFIADPYYHNFVAARVKNYQFPAAFDFSGEVYESWIDA